MLQFWEAEKAQRGDELMGVDMLLFDVKVWTFFYLMLIVLFLFFRQPPSHELNFYIDLIFIEPIVVFS